MKARLHSLLFALLAGVGTICAREGALNGLFSVSADKQVYFSKGNLQYLASTDTWRFAENQYDTIGALNANISDSCSGWIDLFGWGTGNHPTDTSSINENYSTFVDWGTNAISNGGNEANLWRTLTKEERIYLFETRANASSKYGMASVAGVPGIIVLPDVYEGTAINTDHSAWGNNTVSASDWSVYEADGAIFLPASGYRLGTDVNSVGSVGSYWSATPNGTYDAYYLNFDLNYLLRPQSYYYRYLGLSVRLVQERANASTGGTPMFPGDPGTLTYSLELSAAVVDGDELPDYAPEGAGGYPEGTEVTITAQDIPGYAFVRWSDEVTDKSRTIVLNESLSLTALYSHSMIEIAIAAGQWNFICLPPLGDRQYTEDMFTYDGLSDIKWGIYDGSQRAVGKSGWETPEAFNALQGYILYSTTAGTLRINAYVDEIGQGESGSAIHAGLLAYASSHPENESWNFLGNPYSQGFNIAGLAADGIESPITVWNGTAYSTYTPGIDEYTLQPFEAFFIQKSENGAESITFNPEYLEEGDGGSIADDKGTLPGYFSIGEGVTVRFSKGNLQYQASTDTWRFAENQYDTVGALNANISSTYDGWIDLFCWGTGNNPTSTSGSGTFVDWGVNSISNGGNEANLWRTLTGGEYAYLIETRENASALFGNAIVNGVTGLIILPDDWQGISGISFTPGTGEFSLNAYTTNQWRKFESAGAVFLPCDGYRYNGKNVGLVGTAGGYWSSTSGSSQSNARDLDFRLNSITPQYDGFRSNGQSVRLVR